MKNTKQLKKQANNQVSKSVFKEAVLSTKMHKRGLSTPLCLFVLFTLLSLCLAYVSITSLIITVPLVIAPSYFAYYSTGTIDFKNKNETLSFFLLYKAYFSRLFNGSFRLIIGILKAFLVFVVVNSILFLILEATVFDAIPEYATLIENLNNGVETFSSALDKLNGIASTNEKFINSFFISNVASLAFATLEFIHHVAYSTIKLDFNLLRQAPVPMRGFHEVDKMVKKENRNTFFKEYFKATWFIDLLIFLAFCGAGVLEFYVLEGKITDYAFVLALAISVVLLLPFFNYLCEVFHILFARHKKAYEIDFTNLTLELLSKYQTKLGLDDKEANALKEFLNKSVDSKDKNNKDKKK